MAIVLKVKQKSSQKDEVSNYKDYIILYNILAIINFVVIVLSDLNVHIFQIQTAVACDDEF